MQKKPHKISYIKKPFARKSFAGLSFAAVALVSGLVSLGISIRMEGNGGLNIAAWGLSSMIFAVVSLLYSATSFLEKEKNYLLSKIGLGIGAVLLVFWICVVIMGILA